MPKFTVKSARVGLSNINPFTASGHLKKGSWELKLYPMWIVILLKKLIDSRMIPIEAILLRKELTKKSSSERVTIDIFPAETCIMCAYYIRCLYLAMFIVCYPRNTNWFTSYIPGAPRFTILQHLRTWRKENAPSVQIQYTLSQKCQINGHQDNILVFCSHPNAFPLNLPHLLQCMHVNF